MVTSRIDNTPLLVFDIETGPAEMQHLLSISDPFNPDSVKFPQQPGEFDPLSVKTGNLGIDKAAAKIEAARQQHAADVAAYPSLVDSLISEAREAFERKLVERAALSAETGMVLCIGVKSPAEDDTHYMHGDECGILLSFWETFRFVRDANGQMIGHNIYNFDLPFLIRRSWLLGVPFPHDVIERHRFWHKSLVDTMAVWQLGAREDRISLGRLGKLLGVGGKNGSGASFHVLWDLDQEQAFAYLANDLELTYQVAMRLGVA